MNDLSTFLKKYKSRNILLVSGKSSYTNCGFSKVIDKYKTEYNLVRFHDFDTNPKFNDVKKGVDLYNSHNCDAIISVGGGSVMDMGKLISSFQKESLLSVPKTILAMNSFKRKCPLLLVPTTAGSGSEETSFAVLYINGIKYSVDNNSLKADMIILDPRYSFSMSPEQKAISGLDAFTQSIESFWSQKSTTDSKRNSIEALRLIWNNLHDSVLNNNYESHKKIVLASNLAGKAINIAKTTAPHAISYYFTTNHNIKHGHAVCLFFSKIYKYNFSKVDKNNTLLYDMFKTLNSVMGITSLNSVNLIDDFIKKLDIELNLKKLGIDIEKEKENILENVNEQRLKNNPFQIDLKKIIID